VYGLDTVSFAISFCILWLVRPLPAPDAGPEPVTGFASGLRSIAAGFAYARGRRDLLGSYLADLAAMTLAYPNALFPFVAADRHAPWAVGLGRDLGAADRRVRPGARHRGGARVPGAVRCGRHGKRIFYRARVTATAGSGDQ
jgi:hypothetical protein